MKYILCSLVDHFDIFFIHSCVVAALKEFLMSLIAFHSININCSSHAFSFFILDLSLIVGLPILKKLLANYFSVFDIFRILTHLITRNLRTLLFCGIFLHCHRILIYSTIWLFFSVQCNHQLNWLFESFPIDFWWEI